MAKLSDYTVGIVFGVIVLAVFIMMILWGTAEQYYASSYAPAYQKSQVQRAYSQGGEPSNEPQAPGFRESDIEKREGRRFRAF